MGGYNINNPRYVHDNALLAENESNLQKFVKAVVDESDIRSLELNCNKTPCPTRCVHSRTIMALTKKNLNVQSREVQEDVHSAARSLRSQDMNLTLFLPN